LLKKVIVINGYNIMLIMGF